MDCVCRNGVPDPEGNLREQNRADFKTENNNSKRKKNKKTKKTYLSHLSHFSGHSHPFFFECPL
jgi:hypothetical protein